MLKKLSCNIDRTLFQAWKIINKNAKGIVFIVNDRNKLRGVLTDGDIRRFLLEGGNLGISVSKVFNKKFVFARDTESYNKLLSKISGKVKILPIVDEKFKLVNYFEFEHEVRIPIAHPDLKGNEFKYLSDAFLSTWISSRGEYVEKFERNFSSYCQCKYGVSVSNGTIALHLAMKVLGINKDDEVIVPDLTFAATVNAVLHTNATPVMVDVESSSWCINPSEIKKAISKKTKAIIPVHLYGQPCNMDTIMKIAKKHNLFVIEDCAEAHGAEFNRKKVGSFGDIGCFSFYANKILTTGEGGMCITNNKSLYNKMRILRDHGMSKTKKYWHTVPGYNYRMTNLQAAIGVAQLERIDEILKEREKIEKLYKKMFSSNNNIEFQRNNLLKRNKVIWLISILVKKDRNKIIKKLQKKGIDVRPFFYSLSMMPIYKKYVFSNKNSLEISKSGINLPTFNNMSEKDIEKIKKIIL